MIDLGAIPQGLTPLVSGRAQASVFFESSLVILMCSQSWESLCCRVGLLTGNSLHCQVIQLPNNT